MNFKTILKKFMTYSAPVMVFTGKPDSGKTAMALWLTEKGLDWGLIDLCASNIPVRDNRFVKITSLKALEKWLMMFKRKRKMFILDEADKCMTNLDVVTKLSKSFRVPMAFQIRKYHAKLILIYHRLRDVPELYLDKNVTTAFIHKASRKTAYLRSELLFPLIRQTQLRLRHVPQTSISFNTYGIGDFTLKNKTEMEMLELWYKTIILQRRGYDEVQIKAILKN